jgi:hypothetical protein
MVDDIYLEKYNLYSLFLAVDIPRSSGINPKYIGSPLAALATFQGYSSDDDAPAWTQLRPRQPILFRQPRGAMADVIWTLAFWEDNHIQVSRQSYS